VSSRIFSFVSSQLTVSHFLQVRLLPPEARASDLHALGSRFGQVLSVRALMATSVIADPFSGQLIETQTCRGVGFILFKSPDEAERAVGSLNADGFEASFAKVRGLGEWGQR
jgi:RNA recognition motif-containing protein